MLLHAPRTLDIEATDQPVFNSKYAIGEEVALEVAYDLMNFDNDFPSLPLANPTGSTRGSTIAHWRVQ